VTRHSDLLLDFRFLLHDTWHQRVTPRNAFLPDTEWRAFRALWVVLAVYGICLLALLTVRPLWLDEILDLIGARMPNLGALLEYVPRNSGGVPLGYLAQFLGIKVFGFSVFAGRLPSAIFSLFAAVGLAVLAKRIRLRWPMMAVAIFATLPFQLRYAVEARVYSQALCLSVWSTVIFLWIVERPRPLRAAVYSLCVGLAIYTQPFAVFVPLAHLIWACLFLRESQRRSVVIYSGVAIGVACLSFIPWYLHARDLWRESVVTGNLDHPITAKAPLLVLHELVGAGYIGTLLILVLSSVGLWALESRERGFWILYLVAPVIGALIADSVFGYFLAIRQMIFVLVPLSLLAAAGFGRLVETAPIVAWLMIAALFAASAVSSFHFFFLRPRENWASASEVLNKATSEGNCVIFVPPESMQLYAFFRPDLQHYQCGGNYPRQHQIVVAVSPYNSQDKDVSISDRLVQDGFLQRGELSDGLGPRIRFFARQTDLDPASP
jgi:hypothetical protein